MKKENDKIEFGTPLFISEAMKMQSTVSATVGGKIKRVLLPAGTMLDQNDMTIEFE